MFFTDVFKLQCYNCGTNIGIIKTNTRINGDN